MFEGSPALSRLPAADWILVHAGLAPGDRLAGGDQFTQLALTEIGERESSQLADVHGTPA